MNYPEIAISLSVMTTPDIMIVSDGHINAVMGKLTSCNTF